MRILGAVLAGGRSSRFGSEKGNAIYGGRSLTAWAVAALEPIAQEIVICGASYGNLPRIDDLPASGLGPLGGLNAALARAVDKGFDAVLTMPCDTPTLGSGDLAPLTVLPFRPRAFGSLPVCGFWPATLAATLNDGLRLEGAGSMRDWLRRCDAEILDIPPVPNLNTPADLVNLIANHACKTGPADS